MKANLELATTIAHEAYDSKWRRDGKPYISHPLTVMTMVELIGGDESDQIVALCHDIVEDNKAWPLERFIHIGFDVQEVVTPLGLLSYTPEVPDAVARMGILQNARAARVKQCDTAHNRFDRPKEHKIPFYDETLLLTERVTGKKVNEHLVRAAEQLVLYRFGDDYGVSEYMKESTARAEANMG